MSEHACQLCGMTYPDRYLFDLKGSVPGGHKVTCLECRGRLDEREACAKVLDEKAASCRAYATGLRVSGDHDGADLADNGALHLAVVAATIRSRPA